MQLIYKLAVNCLPAVHQTKLNTLLNCFSHDVECTYDVKTYSYAYVCQDNRQYIAVLLVNELNADNTVTQNVHELVTLCVDPKHRKNGYAKQLVQEFIANLPHDATAVVHLDATVPTYPSRRQFFDLFGFEIMQSESTDKIVHMQLSHEACVAL
jgi:N-acetylglutamate synthase-like GNAT family acetyltransferase